MSATAQRLSVDQVIQQVINTDTRLIARFNEILQKLPSETASPGGFLSWLRNALEATDDSFQELLSDQQRVQIVAFDNFFPPRE